MEARERRPKGKTEKGEAVDVAIGKEELKKAFDLSHFDINAILRGAELTLVGGALNILHLRLLGRHHGLGTDSLQPTELCRTQLCLQVNITNKLSMPS